ncbi:type IV fimbrial biogenesis protein FimT [Marinicella litoralis]|uniref:Type II secretion system protein H n=2 Tax=Marinicella litoralis TaxID=644220 RepID=A0A4R6XS19_9GAMM|nr:type IV fimbrial biogenesis protein FimT [Marinicella litoralis]
MESFKLEHMMRLPAQLKGFTLFEMIMGLCLISILSIYAVPNYRTFKQNSVMTQELNRLVANINYARNQSITLSQHIILCSTETFLDCDGESQWHKGWLVFVDLDRNRKYDNNDQLLLVEHKMKTGLHAVASRYRKLIRFDQMGFSPGTNLTIRFCDQRGAESGKAIIISNVGRPRVSQEINHCG